MKKSNSVKKVWGFAAVRLLAKRLCFFAAFTATIIFTLTAATCGSEGAGSKPYVSKTEDGVKYTLSVLNSKGKISANPQEGDTYKLRIEYPNRDVLTSNGNVESVDILSSEMILAPDGGSETLIVTINPGGNIAGIIGNINLPGGASVGLSIYEDYLTAIASGAPLTDSATDSDGGISDFFANIPGGKGKSADDNATASKGNSGGDLPAAKGKLTITNIPAKYNGKYTLMVGTLDDEHVIVGIEKITGSSASDGNLHLPKISGGKVTIPLYISDDNGNVKAYSGSNTMGIMIVPTEKSPVRQSDYDGISGGMMEGWMPGNGMPIMMAVGQDIKFSGGNATIRWGADIFDFADLIYGN